MLGLALFIACLSAFTILILSKFGAIEWVQIYGPKIISRLFECGFCLSFWINCFWGFLFVFLLGDFYFLLSVVVATPLTRKLI